jgi:uncharacterized membrane protein HdeD (DUF308 family)
MSWWFIAFRGAVALVLGVAVLVASWGESFLTSFLAFYFLLAGLAALRSAAAERARGRARLRRGAGIVAIVLAVAVLSRQLVVEVGPDWVIQVVLGIGSIAIGCIRLAGGFVEKDEAPPSVQGRRHLPATEIALGIAELLLGVALLTFDVDRIWPAVAVWGIVGGTALLRDANRRRRHVAATTPQPASRG